ncbi:MAG: DNA polymerase I, partial [Clostridia bacterium]|nr:DNA polymerase I [Clostridia bacterium]
MAGRRQKLALVDGHSLVHRAFFALPPLSTAGGQPTHAVYGFLTMLFKLLETESPDAVAVAFDRSVPTFRHTAFTGYKAQRPEMADDLRSQIPLLRRALEVLRVPVVELDGFEADDVIGTLTRRALAVGWEVVIVTGDRDALQLVQPGVRVLLTRRGVSELQAFDEAAVRATFGVSPRQLVDLKALMGDASDNIPGVPGVGEKTARRLIEAYGSLSGVYEHLEEVGGRLAENLRRHREQAELSRQLVTIVEDAPVEVDLASLRRREPDRQAVGELFAALEFRSLLRRLGGRARGPAAG